MLCLLLRLVLAALPRYIKAVYFLLILFSHLCSTGQNGQLHGTFYLREHRIYFLQAGVNVEPSMSQPEPDIGRDMSLLSLPKTTPMNSITESVEDSLKYEFQNMVEKLNELQKKFDDVEDILD